MADTKKTIIVTKVYDHDCDICKHMSRHDRATFESFPEVSYREVSLDELTDPGNTEKPLTYARIAQYLEKYALNPDYTVDLPVYVFLTKKNEYLGHHSGKATVVELRDRVNSVLEKGIE